MTEVAVNRACIDCGTPLEYHGFGRPPTLCGSCREARDVARRADPEYRRKKAERQREYAKTDRGQEVHKKAKRKYMRTDEARERHVRQVLAYRETEKGRATYEKAQAKYVTSEKGRATLRAGQSARSVRRRGGSTEPGRVTGKDVRRLLGNPCLRCGSRENLQLDHLIPIARGGQHSVGNLAAMCQTCNSAKKDRTWMEMRVADMRAA